MAHTLFGSVDCQLDPAGWSADGGVGRSTLVAALGGLLALAAPGPVIAVEMHPVPWGGLAERIGRSSAGTMWDAVRDLPP